MNPPPHEDYDKRFVAIETKLDANTTLTEKLAGDTAELVEMWKDAGMFFKWMRRAGASVLWVSKVMLAVAAIWAAIRYGWKGEK